MWFYMLIFASWLSFMVPQNREMSWHVYQDMVVVPCSSLGHPQENISNMSVPTVDAAASN
jgi:hypothetical protein